MITVRALFVVCVFCQNAFAHPTATTVTLAVKNAPLSRVLAEVTKQTGVVFDSQLGDPDPKVSVDLSDGQHFWKAVDLIADRAGARVVIQQCAGRVVLTKRLPGERALIVSYDGPFRFCVKRVSATWDLDTDTRTYTADVEVAWEPRLQPLFLDTVPQDVVAVDNQRKRYLVPDAGHSEAPVDGSTSLTIKVPLPALPLGDEPGPARRAAQGRRAVKDGAFPLRDARQAECGPTRPAIRQQTLDGVTCRITRVLLKDRWIVQAAIENPPGGTVLESYQPWDTNNGALAGEQGRQDAHRRPAVGPRTGVVAAGRHRLPVHRTR